jgi:hypothetical protein
MYSSRSAFVSIIFGFLLLLVSCAGVEYGIQRVRGRHDWKNAALGGALTGAIMTLADKHCTKEKIVQTAITGGAIATANELLRFIV